MCTVKDIQAEAILCLVHSLIANYLYENDSVDKITSKYYLLDKQDDLKIKTFMKKLFIDLTSNVLNYSNMQEILDKAGTSSEATIKSRLVEPIAFYYNILAKSMQSRANYLFEKDKDLIYIPEMLGVLLILDFNEIASYSFEKFNFLVEKELEEIAEIYFKYNTKIRKELEIAKNSHIQKQTNIKKMSNLSMFMIEQLLKSNYNKVSRELKRKNR